MCIRDRICTVDRATGDIKLVSVYRDTYLKINSEGTYHKINEAYFKGGHKQAVKALEENLDLSIDNYATFNWKAVADAINILGGVDLEITGPEFESVSYPHLDVYKRQGRCICGTAQYTGFCW